MSKPDKVAIFKLTVIVLSMLVLVFGLGISRLGLNAPRLGPVELDRAVNWAECLAQTEVGAGTPISLVGLGSAAQEAGKTKATLQSLNPPAIDKLKYIATEQVPIELDGADRAADFASGKPVTLPARSQIRVSKGEMEFGNGTVELYNAGGRFLLKVRGHARFRPAEGVNYIITLDHDVTVGSKQEGSQPAKAVLPVGTKGSLKLDKGEPVALTTLQPLAVRPWLLGTSPTLLPERASGHVGLADLAIEVRRPGLQLDGSSVALSACALSGGNAPQQAGVAGIRSQTGGTTTLLLSLPERALPAPFSTTYSAVEMALATSDGNFVGHGGFTAVDRGWAALIALAITGLLFGWLATLRQNKVTGDRGWLAWFAGLFIGADREPSLSLFQVFIWTIITVWGFIYVFSVTGSLLNMTTEMMTLLGIAGAGTVAARWISTLRVSASPPPAANRGAADAAKPVDGDKATDGGKTADSDTPVEFWKLLSSDGHFDLLKLQLFVFTMVIGAYVVWRILDTAAFPALDVNTLLLLGVSQGVYVGGKLASTTGLAKAQTIKLQLENQKLQLDQLKEEQSKLESEKSRLDTAKADPTVPFPAADQKTLDELPGFTAAKKAEIEKLESEIKENEQSLDAVLKEMKLIPA